MTRYEELLAEGDRFRVQYKPSDAISQYQEALGVSGSQDVYLMQMIGVCFQLKHEYVEAIRWYAQAREGATVYQDGNIDRDEAESRIGLAGIADYELAIRLLNDSLRKLPYMEYPAEHAATLGFLSRTEARMGDMVNAVKHGAAADVILSHESNRYNELYAKLHYANTLSKDRQRFKSRLFALKGFRLSLEYGARAHKIRALVLFLGGYRLDDYVRKHYNPK